MFIDRVKESFALNEPIFTEEFLRLFSDYSRVQVFRMIDTAKQKSELVQYAKGVYYLPQQTRFGIIPLTAEEVIRKKYIKNGKEVFGIYSGLKLLNMFSVTTQMAGVIEIITNNESAKCREIQINNRRYILRRSRCPINQNNAAAYTVMQLFSEMAVDENIDDFSADKLKQYVRNEKLTQSQLFSMAQMFPARATKKMIGSGIINDIA